MPPTSSELAPRAVAFVLSLACTLRCRHCLLATRKGERSRDAFREDDLRNAILGLDPQRFRSVLFTGGEPMLHPGLLAAGVEAARHAGLRSLVTSAPVWAKTAVAAEHTLARLPRFDVLILSYDAYHLEHVEPRDYETAIDAASRLGIAVAFNVAYGRTAEKESLERSLAAFLGRLCNVNYQQIVPASPEVLARGVPVETTAIRAASDLDRLPRTCSAGDMIVDFDLRVDLCCWSNTFPTSPLRRSCDQAGALGPLMAELADTPAARSFETRGLLGQLSPEGRDALADLAAGQAFVNECHLCAFVLQDPHREWWSRHLRSAASLAAGREH